MHIFGLNPDNFWSLIYLKNLQYKSVVKLQKPVSWFTGQQTLCHDLFFEWENMHHHFVNFPDFSSLCDKCTPKISGRSICSFPSNEMKNERWDFETLQTIYAFLQFLYEV